MTGPYDAILLLTFGGPETKEDVMPFLENVVAGRNVPRARLEEVAQHYYAFGGKSPINDHARTLVRALEAELAEHGIALPVYWGCRNWHPLVGDVVSDMTAAGVRRALVFVPSAFASYSSCRQYLGTLDRAMASAEGAGAEGIELDKLRLFHNHPGFIDATVDRVAEALTTLGAERAHGARIAFTAHSIPLAMADHCDYVAQLEETCGLIAAKLDKTEWQLVYQSRSGPPQVPWLEPDIGEHLSALSMIGKPDVVVVPIGFTSDHMEVVWDLDEEARRHAEDLGIGFVRSRTVGDHPRFVTMIRELIAERMDPDARRLTVGGGQPAPDRCAPDCCRYERPATGSHSEKS